MTLINHITCCAHRPNLLMTTFYNLPTILLTDAAVKALANDDISMMTTMKPSRLTSFSVRVTFLCGVTRRMCGWPSKLLTMSGILSST